MGNVWSNKRMLRTTVFYSCAVGKSVKQIPVVTAINVKNPIHLSGWRHKPLTAQKTLANQLE